jgi:hypothetical protein
MVLSFILLVAVIVVIKHNNLLAKKKKKEKMMISQKIAAGAPAARKGAASSSTVVSWWYKRAGWRQESYIHIWTTLLHLGQQSNNNSSISNEHNRDLFNSSIVDIIVDGVFVPTLGLEQERGEEEEEQLVQKQVGSMIIVRGYEKSDNPAA